MYKVVGGLSSMYSVPNNIRVAQLKDGPNSQGLYRVFIGSFQMLR